MPDFSVHRKKFVVKMIVILRQRRLIMSGDKQDNAILTSWRNDTAPDRVK
jgi:hypothetical protein